MPGPLRSNRDSGVTLVELMVAIAILGVAVVAIVGGMATAITTSDAHRKSVTAGIVAQNYAEQLKAAAYNASCSTPLASKYPPAPATTGYNTTLTSIEYWNAGTTAPATFADSCVTDPGIQRLTIKVDATDGRASQTVVVTKRNPA